MNVSIDWPSVSQERVAIHAGDRTLQGELAFPTGREPMAGVLLVPPHPHMGGTMENNIIRELASLLAEDYLTLRFDYATRPEDLAKSLAAFWASSRAPEEPELIDDAAAAREFLAAAGGFEVKRIGYSFGAFAASQLDTAGDLVLISPTLAQHAVEPADSRTLVIYSDNDFATPGSMTEQWCNRCQIPRLCHAGADHFFTGCEPLMAEQIRRFFQGGDA